MVNLVEEELKEKAQERVDAKKGFYIHVAAIISVSIILAVLSFIIGGRAQMWILFPILPLALSVFIHYVAVFGFPFTNIMTEDWEEQQLEYETWRLRHKELPPPEVDDELELPQRRKQKQKLKDEDFV